MRTRTPLLRWLMALALVAATGAAAAPGPYALTELGEAPGDLPGSARGFAVNNQGVVAGAYRTGEGRGSRPFVSIDGVLHSLGVPLHRVRSGARGINDHGQVVGETNEGRSNGRAFLWQRGHYTDLGTLADTWAAAKAINNAGTVVGWSGMADLGGHAFVYQGGVMQDIHPFGHYSQATAISPNGIVAGNWWTDLDALAGFVYRDGQAENLDPLHSPIWVNGVNDAGQVVGMGPALDGTEGTHAALWQGGVMHDLGTLGGGNSEALAINAGGLVVGHATVKGDRTWHAFIHAEGRMWSLTALVMQGGEGWHLQTARAINDRGQIVGVGLHDGAYRAFLLTPLAAGGAAP